MDIEVFTGNKKLESDFKLCLDLTEQYCYIDHISSAANHVQTPELKLFVKIEPCLSSTNVSDLKNTILPRQPTVTSPLRQCTLRQL